MNDIGKGIATAGIWIGVAITAYPIGMGAIAVAFFAAIATCQIWE